MRHATRTASDGSTAEGPPEARRTRARTHAGQEVGDSAALTRRCDGRPRRAVMRPAAPTAARASATPSRQGTERRTIRLGVPDRHGAPRTPSARLDLPHGPPQPPPLGRRRGRRTGRRSTPRRGMPSATRGTTAARGRRRSRPTPRELEDDHSARQPGGDGEPHRRTTGGRRPPSGRERHLVGHFPDGDEPEDRSMHGHRSRSDRRNDARPE